VLKGASVAGYPSGSAQDSEDAISFAEVHDVNCMVEPFPFEKVQDAVNHLTSGKARFRAVLTME
jgi:D-arabinose 1-dehydrogenase-like Zn-dependent alcohol dehydrogenase